MEFAAETDRSSKERRRRSPFGLSADASREFHCGLEFQKRAGNQAMQRLLHSGLIHAKSTISQPRDAEEKQADETADRIMRSKVGEGHAACSCAGNEETMCDACKANSAISRKASSTSNSTKHSSHKGVDSILRSPGRGLDASTRTFFEPRFGRSFDEVRVHTDADAAASARSIQARAYAAGEHLVFDTGQFAPESEQGRRLLAHELTHVAQHSDDRSSIIHRDLDPKLNRSMTPEYARGLSDEELNKEEAALAARISELEQDATDDWLDNPNDPGAGSVSPEWDAVAPNLRILRNEKERRAQENAASQRVQYLQVQVITPAEYTAMTRMSADQLPEGEYVSATQAAVPGAGMGMLSQARPGLPVPSNSTGILWEGNHLSDFGVVNGEMTAMGFRAPLPVHAASAIERSFMRGGGQFTQLLNTGGQNLGGESLGMFARFANFLSGGRIGQYRNDWLFPYMPGAKAVYRTDVPPGGAEELVSHMQDQAVPMGEQDYRFSTPSAENPAYARAFGNNPCPPGVNNCITVPSDIHERALGGDNLLLDNDGNPVSIVTGEPGSEPGLARNMNEYVNQPEEFFTNRGLNVTPTAPAMWTRATAGFIRAGGTILMVYGAFESYKRIEEASPEERPIVEAEEVGSWGGGFVGSVVSSALGGAAVCAPAGPGAFFCGLAFGVVGGIVGGILGKDFMHELATSVRMTPAEFINASTLMVGTPEEIRSMCELRALENPDLEEYDPMCGTF